MDFALPPVYSHPDGWGPPPEGDADGLPMDVFNCAFEHLDKYPQPRINRICDFTVAGLKYQEQRAAKGKGKGKGTQQSKPDDEGFALVDNRPLPNKTFSKGRGASFGKGKGKGKGIQVNYQEGILGQKQKPYYSSNQNTGKGGAKGKQKGMARGNQQRRGAPSFKEWSVQTKTEWPMKREILLGELAKLQCDAREVKCEDILWCGELRNYNKEFDRLTGRTEMPVRRFEDLNFFNVTTSEDPFLTDLIQKDGDISVIATDHVLACIIAGARSIYSWDLVITKVDGKIIIDKRDGSQVDFLSVNETANDAPNNDDKEIMNTPVKLGQEASCLNQNFSQMVLDISEEAEQMENPNPFEDEDEYRAASGAYRYRKITIPGNPKEENEFNSRPLSLAIRTEVNSKMTGTGDKQQYVSIKVLNEYDPKLNSSWRKHLESQRGAILATELKNNAFKIGRWTAQAILSGCDVMKLGYASRVDPKDPWSHSVLSVQTHITDRFAEQIGMHLNNVYGIIRSIVNMVMAWDDGKYLLIKDPMKSVIRFYDVPWETFAEEDGGEEEEEAEDEGPELDEDGHVVPQQGGPMVSGR